MLTEEQKDYIGKRVLPCYSLLEGSALLCIKTVPPERRMEEEGKNLIKKQRK